MRSARCALMFCLVWLAVIFSISGAQAAEAPSPCEAGSDCVVLDSDGDGVPDEEELQLGTFPLICDSDGDGLSDGVELRRIQPTVNKDGCHGLFAAGTNFKKPTVMDPLNPDSDGDGLKDGEEDLNGNGWVDPMENDPSIEDSDGDLINDYVEMSGDFDGDQLPDFDIKKIEGGKECSPPALISDLDCDGLPNFRDDDSDNDGCPDKLEGGWLDVDGNGTPDVYDRGAMICPQEVVSGGSSGGASSSPSSGAEVTIPSGAFFDADDSDGGACSFLGDGFNGASGRAGNSAYPIVFSVICCTAILLRRSIV